MVTTETPIVPYIQENNQLARTRTGRRLRRQRQRQRRRHRQNQLQQEQPPEIQPRYQQRQLENQQPQEHSRPWQYHLYQRQQMYHIDIHGHLYRYAEDWEEEQLNEIEGFAILEQLALIRDEIEQEQNIDAEQAIILEAEQQQCQNYEKSIKHEQYEDSLQDDIEKSRHSCRTRHN